MNKKIIIAGGNGFIGKNVAEYLKKINYHIIIIARSGNNIKWEDENALLNAIDNSEMLINLAGKSVDCRYTTKNKKEILSSRVETTKILGNTLLKCKNPPSLWINASTSTIYRDSEDKAMTESDDEIGDGFSVDVAKQWEKSFFDFELQKTRKIALRISIVLGNNGGALPYLINLVKYGIGGKQGNGNQFISWIHIKDVINIIKFVMINDKIEGVLNCTSPNPITNHNFMRILREKMNIKIGIPIPEILLKIGAFIIGTEPELILKSRKVSPEKLLNAGFDFEYKNLNIALSEIIK